MTKERHCPEVGDVMKRNSVPDWPLLATFRWSFGILFSRLVRLTSMDGRVALVPWADMLNHSPEVETFLDYGKSSQGIVFTTDRLYQPGEQVTIFIYALDLFSVFFLPNYLLEAISFSIFICFFRIGNFSSILEYG